MVYSVQTETGCAVDYLIQAVYRTAFKVKHQTPAQNCESPFFLFILLYINNIYSYIFTANITSLWNCLNNNVECITVIVPKSSLHYWFHWLHV